MSNLIHAVLEAAISTGLITDVPNIVSEADCIKLVRQLRDGLNAQSLNGTAGVLVWTPQHRVRQVVSANEFYNARDVQLVLTTAYDECLAKLSKATK